MRIAGLGLLTTAAALVGGGAAAAATAAGSADGAEPPLVALDLDRCPVAPASEVLGLVGVETRRPVVPTREVAAGLAAGPSAGPSAVTAVRVICDGLRAEIEINDGLTGKTVRRVVDLAAAAPVARPHLLALSIVELLAATWIELQSNPRASATGGGAAAGATATTR